ncbi:hypothetical protein [Mangrovibacterium sp.]
MKLKSGRFDLPIFNLQTNTFSASWHDLMMMVQCAAGTEDMIKPK